MAASNQAFKVLELKKEERPFEDCFTGLDTIDCGEPVPVETDLTFVKHDMFKRGADGGFIMPISDKYKEFKQMQLKANARIWGPYIPQVQEVKKSEKMSVHVKTPSISSMKFPSP